MRNKLLYSLMFGMFLLFPSFTHATGADLWRNYVYENISVDAVVNIDTTVDVTEKQTYKFTGEYHQGWRSIPLRRIGSITDIAVVDVETMQPLQYVKNSLKKTDPQSWGKYTFKRTNDGVNIEWYFDAKDQEKTWYIKYKVHGALEFLRKNDRFYWNVFSGYDVAVNDAQVRIFLPEKVDLTKPVLEVFVTGKNVSDYGLNQEGKYFFANIDSVAPMSAFTVNLYWPRGVIVRSDYLVDFWKLNYGIILSLLFFIVAILFVFVRWILKEYSKTGRGVVIPQYEPPRGLRPAEMQVLWKERTNNKTFAAIIVDLAVRGYVVIEEEEKKFLQKQGYKISLTGRNLSDLKKYEQAALFGLFPGGIKHFSTSEIRKPSNRVHALSLSRRVQELPDKIFQEIDPQNQYYEVSPLKEEKKALTWIICGIFWFILFTKYGYSIPQYLWVFISFFILGLCVWAYVKFEARLSQAGRELKEEILGFKMYLYTAERYRLQNLTPDIFEKYLPYAMVFGIEKKWAEAFANQPITQPVWYHSANVAMVSSAGLSSNFSATAFSASFVSSFTGAFSNGGTGAGGSAGGGGGGGGGGAS